MLMMRPLAHLQQVSQKAWTHQHRLHLHRPDLSIANDPRCELLTVNCLMFFFFFFNNKISLYFFFMKAFVLNL